MHLKTHFPLFLRLQDSNDACTQSGLVSLFVHFEARTPYSFTFRTSTLHSPFDNRLLEAQSHHSHKPINSTSPLCIILATLFTIFSSVRAHLSSSHLHGSGCFTIMSPVLSNILELQEASIPWPLDTLRS